MKISDEISLSARNLLRRKGRTALTLVGVVIGTCMVVLMISLGIAQTKTNEEMLQSWGDLTQVQIYGYGTMVGSNGKPQSRQIRTGISDRLRVQVLAGLEEGDRLLMAAPDGSDS